MPRGFLPANMGDMAIFQDLKCHTNIKHFLRERRGSDGVLVVFVKVFGMFYTPGESNTILVSDVSHTPALNLYNYDITFPESIRDPPYKGWIIIDPTCP